MLGSYPPGSAWAGDTVGSHTCGHEAVCGQQKLRGDLHSHLRVRELKQGEVMPLPLPVWDPLLLPVVGCGSQGTDYRYLRITVGFWRFSQSCGGQTDPLRPPEFLQCQL